MCIALRLVTINKIMMKIKFKLKIYVEAIFEARPKFGAKTIFRPTVLIPPKNVFYFFFCLFASV